MMISKTLMAASTRPIILAILSRGEDYGYSIIQKVREISGGSLEWTDGMLYPVLQRMEMDDLIVSKWRLSEENRPRRISSSFKAALLKSSLDLAGAYLLCLYLFCGGCADSVHCLFQLHEFIYGPVGDPRS
jgi:PadR family transcriptional regulator PadR